MQRDPWNFHVKTRRVHRYRRVLSTRFELSALPPSLGKQDKADADSEIILSSAQTWLINENRRVASLRSSLLADTVNSTTPRTIWTFVRYGTLKSATAFDGRLTLPLLAGENETGIPRIGTNDHQP